MKYFKYEGDYLGVLVELFSDIRDEELNIKKIVSINYFKTTDLKAVIWVISNE